MTEWEYEELSFEQVDGATLAVRLNDLGKQGWELVGMTQFPTVKQAEAPIGPDSPDGLICVPGLIFVWVFKRPQSRIKLV